MATKNLVSSLMTRCLSQVYCRQRSDTLESFSRMTDLSFNSCDPSHFPPDASVFARDIEIQTLLVVIISPFTFLAGTCNDSSTRKLRSDGSKIPQSTLVIYVFRFECNKVIAVVPKLVSPVTSEQPTRGFGPQTTTASPILRTFTFNKSISHTTLQSWLTQTT